VELRVLPLSKESSLVADSFVIFGFGTNQVVDSGLLHDVVSTEGVKSETYVEGETDTHLYRLVFQGLVNASLSPCESRLLIRRTADEVWG
jgi:hypothetical protein